MAEPIAARPLVSGPERVEYRPPGGAGRGCSESHPSSAWSITPVHSEGGLDLHLEHPPRLGHEPERDHPSSGAIVPARYPAGRGDPDRGEEVGDADHRLGLRARSTALLAALAAGGYHVFFTSSGDATNPLLDAGPRSLVAVPDFLADAQLRGDGSPDLRASSKARMMPTTPTTQGSPRCRPATPATWWTRSSTTADTRCSTSTVTGGWTRGANNRLGRLPRALPSHRVFSLVPIPVDECSQRTPAPKGCVNVLGF